MTEPVEREGPAYPNITVQLSGADDNVFVVIALVTKGLRTFAPDGAADEFARNAMSCSSYDEVLQLAMRTVNIR